LGSPNVVTKGTNFFQKFSIHLKILGARKLSRKKLGAPTLVTTVQNFVAMVTWHPEVAHP